MLVSLLNLPEPRSQPSPLRPDASREEYVSFYDQVGAGQFEERYYQSRETALARYHLVLGLLEPLARDGVHLLDVGTASGYYATEYARAGGVVTGIDVAEASVALARKRAAEEGVSDRCTFISGDMRELDLGEQSVGAVLMTEVLEHVREQREALRQAASVLRPGGVLIVTTPGAGDALPWWKRLRLRRAASPEAAGVTVERLGRSDSIGAAGIEHEPYFHDAHTLAQMARLLPAELEVVQLRSLWFMPPMPYVWAYSALKRLRLLPSASDVDHVSGDAGDEHAPLRIPAPKGRTPMITSWTRFMWRVPLVNQLGRQVLLVARKPSATSR